MQPVKKSGPFQKPRSKTVKKRTKPAGKAKEPTDKRLPPKKNPNGRKKHTRPHVQAYGTSKLEVRFAHNFLDRLGINYIYQFEAKSIKRFYDFFIPECNVLIEVDGDYYHSYGLVYEQMTPTQKRNKHADEQKNRWAAMNGIKLLRIWEHDINDHPEAVMEYLKYELHSGLHKTRNRAVKKRNPKTEKPNENADENTDTGTGHGEQDL